jgi:hypothetical protein
MQMVQIALARHPAPFAKIFRRRQPMRRSYRRSGAS